MNYFLAKTDPETYSIDDLERDKRTAWDGVTNPQAVRAIRAIHAGDRVFIYHSGLGVVGMAVATSESRDDPKNPKSAVVDLEFAGSLQPHRSNAMPSGNGVETIPGHWNSVSGLHSHFFCGHGVRPAPTGGIPRGVDAAVPT